MVERGSGGEREWWREGVVESEEERGGVGSGGGNGGQLWGVMEGGEQCRERSNAGRGQWREGQ